ncbi:MAG TPA: glycosyltransferase family 25 protein [Jiangellaceae bacterium]|nr:glycosyltransferase family 25 protein [Jiangellaceae bacterium]
MERIYVINLDRKADRWRGIQAELRRMKGANGRPLSDVTRRYSAVDARYLDLPANPDLIDPTYTLAEQLFVQPDTKIGTDAETLARTVTMSRQEVAVALSHIGVWQRVAEGDADHTLVLEDDGFFARSFGRDMSAAWAEVVASTPIKLEPAGSSAPYAQPGSPFDLLYVSCKQVRDACLDQGTMQHVFVPRAGLWQLSGYVLSKPGAQRLLASLRVRGPVDMWINHQFDGLQVLATRRSIVGQRRAASVPGVDQTSSVTRTVSGARTGARTPPTSVSAPRHRLDHREDRIRRRPLSMIAAIPAPDTGDRTGDLWTELQVRRFRTTARSCRAGRVP